MEPCYCRTFSSFSYVVSQGSPIIMKTTAEIKKKTLNAPTRSKILTKKAQHLKIKSGIIHRKIIRR